MEIKNGRLISGWRVKPKKSSEDRKAWARALARAVTCQKLLHGKGWKRRVWHNHGSWHWALDNGGIAVGPESWDNDPPYTARPSDPLAFWVMDYEPYNNDPNVAIRKAIAYMEKKVAELQARIDIARKAL